MTLANRRTWGMMGLLLGALLLWPTVTAWAQSRTPPESRPAIYEFARKLCPICKEMEQVLKEVQGQYGHQLEVRILHIDEEEYLFRRYHVAIVPTQVFLDASGKEVFRHEGLFPRKQLLQKLRELGFIQD